MYFTTLVSNLVSDLYNLSYLQRLSLSHWSFLIPELSEIMSGLEILGATAAGLQIADKMWDICTQILEKPKDTKAVAALSADAQSLSARLRLHELKMKDGALQACQQLRNRLDELVDEIRGLRERNTCSKVATAFKLRNPIFREKYEHMLNEFKVRMCIENQNSVTEMDGRVKAMMEMMKQLKVDAEPLKGVPEMEGAFLALQETIAQLTSDIATVKATARQIREAIDDQRKMLTKVMPQFQKDIKIDGDITRQKIDVSTRAVIDHIDQREEQTNSLTRINAEFLPNPLSLTWYNDMERRPDFRLWSLDNNPNGNDHLHPIGEYEGTVVTSVTTNNTVESIYSKRHIAHEVDEHIRESKRQRRSDVAAYLGLVKRGEYIAELREYMPSDLAERFKTAPIEVRREALRVSRGLGQEFRYAVLDRILRQKSLTLPKIHLQEDLERAMLACNMEKLTVELGFFLPCVIGDITYLYKLQVLLSR